MTLTAAQQVREYVMQMRGVITSRRVAEQLGVNRETVRRILWTLAHRGHITQVRAARNAKQYVLNRDNPPPRHKTPAQVREQVLNALRRQPADILDILDQLGGEGNQVVNACNRLLREGRIRIARHGDNVTMEVTSCPA